MPPGAHWEIPFPEDLDNEGRLACRSTFIADPQVLAAVIVTLGNEDNRQYLDVRFRDDGEGPANADLILFRELGQRVPGPHWELYYENDVDGRIEARTHRHQFILDPNVRSALTTVDEERNYVLHVQFRDGTMGPRDVELLSLREAHRREPEYPPWLEEPPRETLSDEEYQQRVISRYLDGSHRAQLAASMIAPLRERRDYTSIARRAFLVDTLPEGALPIYDRDPNVAGLVTGEVYATTEPEHVGRFPTRQEIPIEDPPFFQPTWSVEHLSELLNELKSNHPPKPEVVDRTNIPSRLARILRDDD
jgi:hypothetical protein